MQVTELAPGVMQVGGVMAANNAAVASAASKQEAAVQSDPNKVLDGLSTHLKSLWADAQLAKTQIEQELLKDLRQRNEEYEADILAKITKIGGSDLFDNITEKLCAAASAWISDLMLFQPDEKPWSIGPTPMSELPPEALTAILSLASAEAQQLADQGTEVSPQALNDYKNYLVDFTRQEIQGEAKTRARRMAVKIEDILAEGNFQTALKEFLEDFVTFRCAFVELTVQKVPKLTWSQAEGEDGSPISLPEVAERIIPVVERFSPFDAYPSNEATSTQDGFFFRRFFPSKTDVANMKGLDGYRDDMIELALAEWQDGKGANTAATDGERARLENKQNTVNPYGNGTESFKFWGPVSGKLLAQWSGNQPGEFEDDKDYEISAILIGRRVIKATINDHPLKTRPLFRTSFRKVNGSFWGKAIPRLVRKNQTMCNSITRAIANNVGFASGPIMGIDQSKLPPGQDICKLYPYQVIPYENRDGQTSKVIDIFQPTLVAPQLEQLLQLEYRKAEDAAGVPPYQYGQEKTAGAGQTLGGLEILQNASTRGIKSAMANIDFDIIKGIIRELWIFVMLFDPDESCKGDIEIKAKGALQLFIKEQMSLRRMNLLNSTANPIDQQIKGILGRAKELRELYKSVQIDPEGIVPDEQQMEQQVRAEEAQQAAQAQQQVSAAPPGGAPA